MFVTRRRQFAEDIFNDILVDQNVVLVDQNDVTRTCHWFLVSCVCLDSRRQIVVDTY